MKDKMRIMTERPLNAETPVRSLRSWITPNSVFFKRNQGEIPQEPVSIEDWELYVEGAVERELRFRFEQILNMPRVILANTLECSGNGRSLLNEKAVGNPWTIGGAGNAIWGGVWLKDLLLQARPVPAAKHVAFEGFDKPTGSRGVRFIRSIPLEKAMTTTLLAYEMNGEPLPLAHGYPLRALALGWTGANCVKWLSRITLLEKPYEGFYMDKAYRVYDRGEESEKGAVVTQLSLKSTITQPLHGDRIQAGDTINILGSAYAGEKEISAVSVSLDGGATWEPAELIGPRMPFAWVMWQKSWKVEETGAYTILSRAADSEGNLQPMEGRWNVLGYGNNGVREHGITVEVG